jgi:hypothetical protein
MSMSNSGTLHKLVSWVSENDDEVKKTYMYTSPPKEKKNLSSKGTTHNTIDYTKK